MAVKKGLGRGVSAIFEENGAEFPTEKGMVKEIRISDIEPNRDQPRKVFDNEQLTELSNSIAANGVLQPILVREINGRYQIIAGERRWRAAKLAGLKEIPAVISDLAEDKIMEVALIENLQREDLNPLEESRGYAVLQKKYGLTQEEIAARVSKSRPAVANALRLLTLPDKVLDMISRGSVSAGHARALLSLKDPSDMEALAARIEREGLSVRDAERIARQMAKGQKPPSNNKPAMETFVTEELEKQLGSVLKRKVKLQAKSKNKGIMEIEYYSNDDLEELLHTLGIEIEL
ncbi:MAG: ParB/RepB/Spo0J family partition protein [Bacillota bacterium]|nr:ParB/RepB/Spo0J family partition protein [Bacillota bacterium]